MFVIAQKRSILLDRINEKWIRPLLNLITIVWSITRYAYSFKMAYKHALFGFGKLTYCIFARSDKYLEQSIPYTVML